MISVCYRLCDVVVLVFLTSTCRVYPLLPFPSHSPSFHLPSLLHLHLYLHWPHLYSLYLLCTLLLPLISYFNFFLVPPPSLFFIIFTFSLPSFLPSFLPPSLPSSHVHTQSSHYLPTPTSPHPSPLPLSPSPPHPTHALTTYHNISPYHIAWQACTTDREVTDFLATLPQDPLRCVVKPVQSAGTDDGTFSYLHFTVHTC